MKPNSNDDSTTGARSPSPRVNQLNWMLVGAALIMLIGMQFWFWGWLTLGFAAICLAVSCENPRRRWTVSGQQACAGFTWGFAAMWAGLLFVGWKEPLPAEKGFDATCRITTSGFPIPGVRRFGYEFPDPVPGENPAVDRYFPRPCFGLDRDWLVLIINALVLVTAGVTFRGRFGQRRLRMIQITGGVAAAVLGTLGAVCLEYDFAYSMVNW